MTHFLNASPAQMALKAAITGNVPLFNAIVEHGPVNTADIITHTSLADMREHDLFFTTYDVLEAGHLAMLKELLTTHAFPLYPLHEFNLARQKEREAERAHAKARQQELQAMEIAIAAGTRQRDDAYRKLKFNVEHNIGLSSKHEAVFFSFNRPVYQAPTHSAYAAQLLQKAEKDLELTEEAIGAKFTLIENVIEHGCAGQPTDLEAYQAYKKAKNKVTTYVSSTTEKKPEPNPVFDKVLEAEHAAEHITELEADAEKFEQKVANLKAILAFVTELESANPLPKPEDAAA